MTHIHIYTHNTQVAALPKKPAAKPATGPLSPVKVGAKVRRHVDGWIELFCVDAECGCTSDLLPPPPPPWTIPPTHPPKTQQSAPAAKKAGGAKVSAAPAPKKAASVAAAPAKKAAPAAKPKPVSSAPLTATKASAGKGSLGNIPKAVKK